MKKILFSLLFIGFALTSQAQYSVYHLNWNVGLPTGDLKNYIDDPSALGFSFGGRHFIYDFFSVGGSFGWQTFDQKISGTQENGNIQLTGTQFRYVNTYPLMFNVHYYLGEDGGIRPYLGTGVGVTWVNERTDMGIYTSEIRSTHFGLAPEVGVIIPFGASDVGLLLGAKYEQAFKSSNDRHISYLSFNIALAFID